MLAFRKYACSYIHLGVCVQNLNKEKTCSHQISLGFLENGQNHSNTKKLSFKPIAHAENLYLWLTRSARPHVEKGKTK